MRQLRVRSQRGFGGRGLPDCSPCINYSILPYLIVIVSASGRCDECGGGSSSSSVSSTIRKKDWWRCKEEAQKRGRKREREKKLEGCEEVGKKKVWRKCQKVKKIKLKRAPVWATKLYGTLQK